MSWLKYKIICCDVIEEEIKHVTAMSEHTFEIEYSKKAEHEKPDELRVGIQKMIDHSEGYDAILIGYGLCGNAIAGLKANKIPLIVPRAHDCCTLFLGSRKRFNELFEGKESMGWGSTGYCRRDGDYLRNSDTGSILGYDRAYDEYVEEYGKENADFIWDSIHPVRDNNEVLFISIPETDDNNVLEQFKDEAIKIGKTVRIEEGSINLLKKFAKGLWDEDFLVVKPGCEIKAVYGRNEIIKSWG